MDRPKIYAGQGVLSADLLNLARDTLIGLGKMFEALYGSSTVVDGLGCTPGPAMNVYLGAGQIWENKTVDPTTYGTLAADTHALMKQGLLKDPVLLATPAPVTVGQSINYLIEVQFQEVDQNAVVLPYYDSANPTVMFVGPNGDGTANTTTRADICAVNIKAGASATTGTQVTPTVTAGWTALYVISVPYGAASILAGYIAASPSAPFLSPKLSTVASTISASAISRARVAFYAMTGG